MADQNNVDQDSLISQFVGITGAEEEIAKNTLEAFNWDLAQAINIFVDSNLSAPLASINTGAAGTNMSPGVQIPNVVENLSDTENDDVRAPIPPVRQILIDEMGQASYSFRPEPNRVEAFRDFQRETRWQEEQMMQELETPGTSTSTSTNRNKTFEDLFRPPLDLLFRGSFEMAKFEGQRLNKWLMINIQNSKEFACQVLNRDVWSNPAVKSIIKEHFMFWQSYNDTNEGRNYMNLYRVSFPYVAIIDPRTGELVREWNKVETVTFCDKLTQFLTDHPSPLEKDLSTIQTQADAPETNEMNMFDVSEELQMKAAIEASLNDMKNEEKKEDDEAPECQEIEDEVLEDDTTKPDDWRNYLGDEESPKIEIVIRYPDGKRENVIFPSTSKMKALFLFVVNKGYTNDEYDLITNFPKKNLSKCPESMTIEEAGLHSRDTLYVQMNH